MESEYSSPRTSSIKEKEVLLDRLISEDRKYIDFHLCYISREPGESLYGYLHQYLKENGVEDVGTVLTLTYWYYIVILNYENYSWDKVGALYLSKIDNIIENELNNKNIQDKNIIRVLASILNWKNVQLLYNTQSTELSSEEFWLSTLPNYDDVLNKDMLFRIEEIESGKIETQIKFNNVFFTSIKSPDIICGSIEALRHVNLRRYLKIFCFRSIISDDLFLNLLFESLEKFLNTEGLNINCIAFPLSNVLLYISENKDNNLTFFKDNAIRPIESIHNPEQEVQFECARVNDFVHFLKTWREWRRTNNPSLEVHYLICTLGFFFWCGNEDVYSYFYKKLKFPNYQKFLDSARVLRKLCVLNDQKIIKSYYEQRSDQYDYNTHSTGETIIPKFFKPLRSIEEMVSDLNMPRIIPSHLPVPERFKIENINTLVNHLVENGYIEPIEESFKEKGFGYFFGFGRWDYETDPPYITWKKDWNELGYFLRVLYAGFLNRHENLVFKNIPNGVWDNIPGVFRNTKGDAPKDTLKTISLPRHEEKEYTREINKLLIPILKSAYRTIYN